MDHSKLDQKAIELGCYYDQSSADKVKHFIEKFCRQSKGDYAGQAIKLLPWQDSFLSQLFGWKRKDHTRRYRRAAVFVPKKNGKSTLLSAVALALLVADNEPGGEVYTVANDQNQASIIFQESVSMVEQSPQLARKLKILKTNKKIEYAATKSIYRALSAEKSGKHGYNASAILADEVSFWDDRALWDVLRYATAFRQQPLTISISTAGYDLQGLGRDIWDYAAGVRDGTIDDPYFLPLIYCAEDGDDWTSPSTWHKANPSPFALRDMAEACQEAKNDPRKEANFKSLRLNLWQGTSNQWLSSPMWSACAKPFDPTILDGRECYGGCDLARVGDLAAYVLLFSFDGLLYLLPRFFIPKLLASKKEHTDKVPYVLWGRQGHIILTDGDVIDYGFIRDKIKEDSARFKILEFGYDPYYAGQLSQQLMEDGLQVVPIRQTYSFMSPATSALERFIKEGRLRAGNNPVLSWCAMNASVREDAQGNIMVSKKSETKRCDGITAAIMAVSRYLVAPDDLPQLFVF